jgi:hypothetical protein
MSHVDAIAVLLESYEAKHPERLAGRKGIKRGVVRANPPCGSASPHRFTRKNFTVTRTTAFPLIFPLAQAEDWLRQ